MAKSQRSLVAQLRAGILPLAPDVGRFKHFQEDNKLCELYEMIWWNVFSTPRNWDEDDNRIMEWLFDVISNACKSDTNCSLHVAALVSNLFFPLTAVSCNQWTAGFDFIPCWRGFSVLQIMVMLKAGTHVGHLNHLGRLGRVREQICLVCSAVLEAFGTMWTATGQIQLAKSESVGGLRIGRHRIGRHRIGRHRIGRHRIL